MTGFGFLKYPRMKRHTIALLLIASCALSAKAQGLKGLEEFMRTAKSGRASFTQTVTSPPREGQATRTKTSSGQFAFQRPQRFRFDYQKPFVQTIVADGLTLWLYDHDLNQVTARNQAEALGNTPAALIAMAADLKALDKDFQLHDQPASEGLDWVLATPRSRDSQVQQVRLGFNGAELAALDILDGFGQRSVLRFARFELNPSLPATQFQFKPPAGADVVRNP